MLRLSILIFALACSQLVSGQIAGEACTDENTSSQGICRLDYECPSVLQALYYQTNYTKCGFEGKSEIVCCPDDLSTISTTTTFPQKNPNLKIDETQPVRQQKCILYGEAPIVWFYWLQVFRSVTSKCGQPRSKNLLLGGEYAKPREFPSLAVIGFVKSKGVITWSCSGTLISEDYVLTAAHCLHSPEFGKPKYIRLGDLDLLSEEDEAKPITYQIVEVIPHPDYTTDPKHNDIGLLRMDRKIKLNPYVFPACLPNVFDSRDQRAIVAGWGYTNWSNKNIYRMNKVTLNRFSDKECMDIYGNEIRKKLNGDFNAATQMCAGLKIPRNDSCQGDTGGPLLAYNKAVHCTYTILGVTSCGFSCNVDGPGIYTRVFPYVDWIERTVWKEEVEEYERIKAKLPMETTEMPEEWEEDELPIISTE